MTLGPDSALRNYTSNRFKVVHHEVMQFNADNTKKWFDITINVNKNLQYEPSRPTGPIANSDPVNYNLVCVFSTVPTEQKLLTDPGYTMGNPASSPPGGPIIQVPLLVAPNLSQISSRTYFREA